LNPGLAAEKPDAETGFSYVIALVQIGCLLK
jgi:hypothetical protein